MPKKKIETNNNSILSIELMNTIKQTDHDSPKAVNNLAKKENDEQSNQKPKNSNSTRPIEKRDGKVLLIAGAGIIGAGIAFGATFAGAAIGLAIIAAGISSMISGLILLKKFKTSKSNNPSENTNESSSLLNDSEKLDDANKTTNTISKTICTLFNNPIINPFQESINSFVNKIPFVNR